LRLREEAAACLALCDLRVEQTTPAAVARLDPHCVAFDASLSRIALIETSGEITVRQLADAGAGVRVLPARGAAERIAMSPSGSQVAAMYRDASGTHVAIWSPGASEMQPQTLEIDDPACLAFDPSGDRLGVVTAGGAVHLFDLRTNRGAVCCQIQGEMRGCRFDESGKRLAVWGGSRLAVLSLPEGKLVRRLAHRGGDQIQAAAFSPDGRWLVTGSSHHLAFAWDQHGSEPVHVLKGHEGWVTAVAFPPSGNFVATASSDGTTRLWEHWTARELVVASGYGVQFDREGCRLAGLTDSASVLFEVATSERQTGQAGTQAYESRGSVISPDSRLVASWSDDGVRLWDCSTACELGRIDSGPAYWARWRRTEGGLVLLTGSSRGVSATDIRWPASSNHIIAASPIPLALPPEIDCPQHVALSRDGGTLSIATGHGQIGVLALEGGHNCLVISDSKSNYMALSASGDCLVTFDAGASGMARWDARTGQRIGDILEDERVLAAGFSPCGDWLVVDNGREVIALDTQSWRERRRIALPHSSGAPSWQSEMSFAVDNNLLAISRAGYHIVLLEPDCQRVLATLPAELPYAPTCLSPDGTHLACSGSNSVLQLWNLENVRRNAGTLGVAW
jgi:WD40 repeat protein